MDAVKEQIKNNIHRAEKIFSTQMINARDYITKERELGFFPEMQQEASTILPNQDALQTMSQHPFTQWLRQQTGYLQAKDQIISGGLLVVDTTTLEIIKQYREAFALERLTALHIHLFTGNKKKLTQVVVTQREQTPVMDNMRKLQHVMNKGGGLYFDNAIKQHLFQYLLEDSLNNPGSNVYSAKRSHESVLRQTFTTNFAQGLFRVYEKISVEQVTNIALDITSIFFMDTMDKRDANRVFQEVSRTVDAENEFLNKTVMDILMQDIIC